MRLISLAARDFKRIVAVEIRPVGPVFQICGENAAGKSSCLDILSALVGGKKYSPECPVRIGATGCTLLGETDQYTIRRKWTEKSDSLVIETKDGAVIRRPQELLDKLFGPLTFDPLAFSRMKPKEQAALLRQAIGLDTSAIDQKRKAAYDARTLVNRDIDQLAAQIQALVIPADPGEIGRERDEAEIAGQKLHLERQRNTNAENRALLVRLRDQWEHTAILVDRLSRELQQAIEAKAAAADELANQQAVVATLTDPDATEIDRQIADAKAWNAQVRSRQNLAAERRRILADRQAKEKTLKAHRDKAEKLTGEIQWADADKAEMLAKAKFPIPGMTVDDDGVKVNGIPYSQASSAEQIRIGLGIAAALHPDFRCVLVHDGSLLSEKSMVAVHEWAQEHDTLVLIERVTPSKGGVGVVITDGTVSGPIGNGEPEKAADGVHPDFDVRR